MLSGVQAGRYDLAFGPIGDFPERQERYDFVDFVKDSDALILQKGNPQKIRSLADVCGKRIGVIAGGASEQILKDYSQKCVKQNKKTISIQAYTDMPTGSLAIRSGRVDAMLESLATCSYFVGKSEGGLEMVRTGVEDAAVYEEFYQGAIVPKGSPLTPVLLAAYQRLFENGTYTAIMKKWHLNENMLPTPGINLSANPVGNNDG